MKLLVIIIGIEIGGKIDGLIGINGGIVIALRICENFLGIVFNNIDFRIIVFFLIHF